MAADQTSQYVVSPQSLCSQLTKLCNLCRLGGNKDVFIVAGPDPWLAKQCNGIKFKHIHQDHEPHFLLRCPSHTPVRHSVLLDLSLEKMCHILLTSYSHCPHTISSAAIPCATFPLLNRCVKKNSCPSGEPAASVEKIKGNINYCESCYEHSPTLRMWLAVEEAELHHRGKTLGWSESRMYQELRQWKMIIRVALTLSYE